MKNRRALISAIAPFAAVLSTLAPADAGATPAAARARADVAVQFVSAANGGDYRTVCGGAQLYGRYDYRIVGRSTLADGRLRVDLIRWQHPSFIELVHEQAGWRVIAGGW